MKTNFSFKNLYKKTYNPYSSLYSKLGLDLRNVVKNSYKPQDNIGDFVLDKELSGKRQQVYTDPSKKELLYTVAGTRSGTDILNDFRLVGGGVKNTERFKVADRTLKDAKQKYDGYNTTIVGSSLGGAIGSRLGGEGDTRYTYNTAGIGGKNRSNNIRDSGDIISIAEAGNSYNFGSGLGLLNPMTWLNSHSSNQLQGKDIFI